MKTFKLAYNEPLPIQSFPETIAAIGFFDGIHKGHQKVIGKAIKAASNKNMKSAVITFHPHPSVILKESNTAAKYITPLSEKKQILKDMDVDRLYIIEFSKDLSLITPEQFIDYFITQLNIQHLIAGFDFTFGHKGAGNMDNLASYAQSNFSYEVVPKVEFDNEKISSTKIRQLLNEGNIEEATHLLGRHLTLTGVVASGEKRGRTIGFPTANITLNEAYLLPKIGVYAVEVCYKNQIYQRMTNLGMKPTFESNLIKPTLEVFIFDFNETIYGEELTIKWHKFIRNEQKFSGVDALVNQLNTDDQMVKEYFLTQHKHIK